MPSNCWHTGYSSSAWCLVVLSRLEEQERWLEAQVEAHASDDPHWRAVGLVVAQFNGLVEGYQARARQASSSAAAAVPGRRMASAAPADAGSVGWLDRADLVFLNNNGELYDIIDHLQDRKQAGLLGPGERHTVRPDQVFDIVALRGRCSALIKVGLRSTCHSGYMACFYRRGFALPHPCAQTCR